MSIVTIFGSGNSRPGDFIFDSAELSGRLLADSGFDIATGGYNGIMEASMKGAANSSKPEGRRIAIINSSYKPEANKYANEIIDTHSYLERLTRLIEIADAYLIFPGGTGTLVEFSLVWAFKDRNIMVDKPVIAIGEQWNELIRTMGFYSDRVMEKAFLIEPTDNVILAVEKLIDYLR